MDAVLIIGLVALLFVCAWKILAPRLEEDEVSADGYARSGEGAEFPLVLVRRGPYDWYQEGL